MRVLLWHVHGGWMNSFLRGEHDYLIPADPAHPPAVMAPNIHLVEPSQLRDLDIDVVVLQRLEELSEGSRLLRRTVGRDLPAVFVEHNTPRQSPVWERHPLADRDDIVIAHVTHFNRLVWDCGDCPTTVIEHGIPDPGYRYTGEIPALGVVVNEPVRRGRVAGTDLLPDFARAARLDCFGIDTDLLPDALGLPPARLRALGDLDTETLHTRLARRRAYLHPLRWTSLGLSLLEAMSLGMPVLALATTEAPRAIPPEAGAISSDPGELTAMARALIADPAEARRRGRNARRFARRRYGLQRFLTEWDQLLQSTVASGAAPATGSRTSLLTEGAHQ